MTPDDTTRSVFLNASSLLQEALICAIRDREGYAAADPGEEGELAFRQANAFRVYFEKRFGFDPSPYVNPGLA